VQTHKTCHSVHKISVRSFNCQTSYIIRTKIKQSIEVNMHNNKLVLSVRHIGFFILWSSLAVNPAILLRVLVSLTPSPIFIFVLGVKFSIYDEEAAVAWRTEQSATVRYCVHIKRNKVCFPLPLFNKHHRVLSWSLSYFIQNRVVQISLINAKHSCSTN